MAKFHYHKIAAHEKHKVQVQAIFDFAVTICHAIPSLSNHIAEVEAGKTTLPKPIYFHAAKNSTAYLKKEIANFEARLSSYLYLSLFSFFEAFVDDAIQELIDFHGGADAMRAMAERRDAANTALFTDPAILRSVRKLKKDKKGKELKYRKYSATLRADGFRFPTERFSAYGVRMLIEKHVNLKAHAILDFLAHGLALPVTAAERKAYDTIRQNRNQIAHGQPVSLTLDDVRKANDFFREMTFKINAHLLANFFIVEKYAY